MYFDKKAALIAMIIAVPVALLASFFWLSARTPSVYSITLYWFGDIIFQLGFPLTTIIFGIFLEIGGGRFTEESELWALPILIVAFIAQWVFWSQFISIRLKRPK